MTIIKSELDSAICELRQLCGAQIQRITQPSTREICWQLRYPSKTFYLLFSIEHNLEALYLQIQRPPSLPTPSDFCMALRKHILNARIHSIFAIPNDRIAGFVLSRGDILLYFLAEFIPRRGNLILCSSTHQILHLHHPFTAHRSLHLGDAYNIPNHDVSRPETLAFLAAIPHNEPCLAHKDTTSTQDRTEHYSTWQIADFPTHQSLALKYGHTHSQQRLKLLKQIAASNYRQKLKKLYRLLGNLENDYHKCEHKLLRERDAELLKSNLYLVKRGIPQIQVADYFEPDMPTRQIDLDPALSPKDNLFRLFHQIKRAKRGIEALTPRISETKNQIQQLEQQLSLIDSISDVDHIADLLPNTPTTTHNSAHCAQSSAQTRNQHLFREFLSNSAQSILVGKDGIGNDFLTFRHARGNDLWLHARGVPGSHIVVPLQRNQQPSNDLLIDAATLAAHFSKARDHSLVDIIYTLVKYVRKPKNALPGQVSILRDNNLSLRLEPERLQRLLASSQLLNSNLHKKQ